MPHYKAQFTNTRLLPCYAMTVFCPANSHGQQCAPTVFRACRVVGISVSRTQSSMKIRVVVEPVGGSSVYAVPTESPQIAHTQPYLGSYIQDCVDGFGGLVVSMLASGTQICGFKPGRSRWIGRKNPQHAFLRRGNKRICPMSQLCGMSKNLVIYVNYGLLAKFQV